MGCEHSPSVSGGVARRKSRQKNSESRLGARSGVANESRECGRERESWSGVASVVANVSRENESRM